MLSARIWLHFFTLCTKALQVSADGDSHVQLAVTSHQERNPDRWVWMDKLQPLLLIYSPSLLLSLFIYCPFTCSTADVRDVFLPGLGRSHGSGRCSCSLRFQELLWSFLTLLFPSCKSQLQWCLERAHHTVNEVPTCSCPVLDWRLIPKARASKEESLTRRVLLHSETFLTSF